MSCDKKFKHVPAKLIQSLCALFLILLIFLPLSASPMILLQYFITEADAQQPATPSLTNNSTKAGQPQSHGFAGQLNCGLPGHMCGGGGPADGGGSGSGIGSGGFGFPDGNGGGGIQEQGQGQGQGGGGFGFPDGSSQGPFDPGVQSPSANFLEYTNPNLGFSVGYPSGAQVIEEELGVSVLVPETVEGGPFAMTLAIQPNVNVGIQEFGESYLNYLRQKPSGVEILAGPDGDVILDVTLGVQPAQMVHWAEGEYKGFSIWTVVSGTGYGVTFATPQQNIQNAIDGTMGPMMNMVQITHTGGDFGGQGSNGGGTQDQGGFGFPDDNSGN
jgi:hypothetical protein